jgi:hypothetical protein
MLRMALDVILQIYFDLPLSSMYVTHLVLIIAFEFILFTWAPLFYSVVHLFFSPFLFISLVGFLSSC